MELGEWIGGWVIEKSDNRGLDNRGSTVYKYYIYQLMDDLTFCI